VNITVHREEMLGLSPEEVVEEYGLLNLEIHVDKTLPYRTQQNLVIHAVIEGFCRNWPHDKVEELEGYIRDALDNLDEATEVGSLIG